MSSGRSKTWWATAVGAIVILAVAGLLIGGHDAGGGAQARSVPDRDAIYAAELVGPQEGWARTSSRLAWTTDGGASWSTITPPGVAPGSILAVRFDGSGDGMVVACQDINAVPSPLEFFRTADDGRTWRAAKFDFEAEGPGSIGSVRASEADGTWWVLVDEAGVAREGKRLYRSVAAGRRWREALRRPPASGQFTFFSADEGWIVDDQRAQAVYRTGDGGDSWNGIEVPLPPPTKAEARITKREERLMEREERLAEREGRPAEPGLFELGEGKRRQVEYGLPGRGPGGILLPVTITSPEGRSEILLYERSGGGRWKVVATIDLAHGAANAEVTTSFVAPGELLIQDPVPPSAPPPSPWSRRSPAGPGPRPRAKRSRPNSDAPRDCPNSCRSTSPTNPTAWRSRPRYVAWAAARKKRNSSSRPTAGSIGRLPSPDPEQSADKSAAGRGGSVDAPAPDHPRRGRGRRRHLARRDRRATPL